MTAPEDTEHGCSRTRARTPDRNAGRELDRLRAQGAGDEDWQAHCDLLAAVYEDVLHEQAPCAAWDYWGGTVTVCCRHVGRVKPRAAWLTAEARVARARPR